MHIWDIENGLISILVGFFSLILAIFLAFLLQGTVSEFLYNDTPVGNSILKVATNFVTDFVESKNDETAEDKNTMEFLNNFLLGGEESEEIIIENASTTITKYILSGISFIGILIIVLLICYILTMLLNVVFDFPLLTSINKFGGIGINVIKTLLKIWIVFAVISFISTLPLVEPIIKQVNGSVVTKFLYENNLLVNIIQSTIKI